MKLVLPFALFLVVITVEGNLRGDRSDGDNVPRSLKKCKNMMGDPPCPPTQPPTPTDPDTGRDPPTQAPTPTDPDTGRDPEPSTGPFDTCGVTSYQNARNVRPCFRASDCDSYDPDNGVACCLRFRCICGSDWDAGGPAGPCANFDPDPLQRVGYGLVYGPTVTVPTVDVPPIPTSPPTSGPTSP